MASTTTWFGQAQANVWDGTRVWDWNTHTIKCSIHTSTFAPNVDTMDTYDEVTNEIAATGDYPTGGVTLLSPTVTVDSATNQIRLDAADFTLTAVTIPEFRYYVVYRDTGVASTSPLICLIDWGTQTITANNLITEFDATGVIRGVY